MLHVDADLLRPRDALVRAEHDHEAIVRVRRDVDADQVARGVEEKSSGPLTVEIGTRCLRHG